MSVTDSLRDSVREDTEVFGAVGALALLMVVGLVTGIVNLTFLMFLLSLGGVYALLTMGLNVQWGYTGLINFSVAAFWGIGAYSAALLTASTSPLGLEWHPITGFLVAIVASAVIAVAIAVPTLRLREDYLAIASLGLAEVVRRILLNEEQWTAGSSGVSGIPKLLEGLPLTQAATNLTIVVVLVALVYLFLRYVQRSPWGRVLRTVRSDEDLAKALGKNTFSYKLQAFVIGSVIMAISGAFYVHLNLYTDPSDFAPLLTFYIWVAVILGGTGSNRGAVLGAITVIAIREGPDFLKELAVFQGVDFAPIRLLVVGLLIIAVVRFRPSGLLPPRDELIWPGGRRKPEGGEAE